MNVLNNLKTSVKLISSFMVLALLTGVIGGISIYYLRQIDSSYAKLIGNNMVGVSKLADLSVAFQRTRVNLRDILLTPSVEGGQAYLDTINQLSTEIDELSAEYEALIITEQMQGLFDEYTALYEEFSSYRDKMIALDQQGNDDEALIIMRGDALASAKALEAKIEEMRSLKLSQAEEASVNNSAQTTRITTFVLLFVVMAVIIGIALGVVIARSIAVPLGLVTKMAQALAVGNLVRDVSDVEKDKVRLRQDEVGMIGQAFDGLSTYMQNMSGAAASIAN